MPGFPVKLAGLIGRFGDDWLVLKSSMIVLALFTMILSRWFFRRVVPRSASTPLALVLASTPIVFDYAHRLMSEIPAMASSMLALLAMLKVVEKCEGRGRWAWGAVLVLAGPIAVLIRGNALAIAPALFFGVLRFAGPGERRARAVLGCGLLAIVGTFVAWSIRCEQRQYYGIHNVTYINEMQSKNIGALWEASGKFGDGVERVDAAALANRAYVNFAWYQVYRVAGFLIPSSAGLSDVKLSKLGFVLALLLLVPYGVGFARLARRSPELSVFLASSLLLVVVYPTGGSRRMLLPIIPMLLATGYLGLERMIGTRSAVGWLIGLAVLNLATCAVEADRQRLQPYSRAGFDDFLRIIDIDLLKVSRSGEMIGSDFPEPVAALTGTTTREAARALSAVSKGEASSALLVCLDPLAVGPDLEATTIARRGQCTLLRITGSKAPATEPE
jgi:4-amino-4-deoxy-L-arabinose transferase-like glycosyltransferase